MGLSRFFTELQHSFYTVTMKVMLTLLPCLCFLTGCGTLGTRLQDSALQAVRDPGVIYPAAAAVLITIDNADHELSEWAVEHTPVFGSQQDALNASDDFRNTLRWEAIVTGMATPPVHTRPSLSQRLTHVAGDVVIIESTSLVTGTLKHVTGRERPDGSNKRSLPSGHSSGAFAAMTVANRHISSLPPAWDYSLTTLNWGLAAGTAWARVEGNVHFPSDVLAGAALGRFMGLWLEYALFPDNAAIAVDLSPDSTRLGITLFY